MAENDESVLIDLRKYGGEGYLEMMYPPYSRTREIDNIVTAMVTKVDKNGKVTKDMSKQNDAVLLKVLSYVESGPFERTLESFLEYTDVLDRVKRGNGQKLYTEMLEAVGTIDEGLTSPSPDSPGAENGSSE